MPRPARMSLRSTRETKWKDPPQIWIHLTLPYPTQPNHWHYQSTTVVLVSYGSVSPTIKRTPHLLGRGWYSATAFGWGMGRRSQEMIQETKRTRRTSSAPVEKPVDTTGAIVDVSDAVMEMETYGNRNVAFSTNRLTSWPESTIAPGNSRD
ncbi:hypothetical protein BS47DRAFT_533487 [Hydnum rufescens UP504]|uniref:Uncharacterized protein n=1 Tax=Hydnum rufescens UP504 TaxID=1448309 RepID=A0A9P6DXG9_9AGAM|nr:hypothetical protein BS47DRAFT_533487 [Hydnum rufescens UP504]